MMNFDEAVGRIKGACLATLNKGEQIPTCILLFTGNDFEMVGLADVPKQHMSEAITALVQKLSPDFVILVTENWMVARPVPEGEKIDTSIVPSEQPDRIECVLITVKSPTYHTSHVYKIIRKGNKVQLDEMDKIREAYNRYLDTVFTVSQHTH